MLVLTPWFHLLHAEIIVRWQD